MLFSAARFGYRRCSVGGNVSVMIGFLIFLLITWAALSIAGFVIKGLFWLAVVGLILFIVTAVAFWIRNKTVRE